MVRVLCVYVLTWHDDERRDKYVMIKFYRRFVFGNHSPRRPDLTRISPPAAIINTVYGNISISRVHNIYVDEHGAKYGVNAVSNWIITIEAVNETTGETNGPRTRRLAPIESIPSSIRSILSSSSSVKESATFVLFFSSLLYSFFV